MKRLATLILAYFLLSFVLCSQPTVIFNGGKGQGYSTIKFLSNTSNVTLKGGTGSGYVLTSVSSMETFYIGGKGQGYAYDDVDSSQELINALGGQGDGYVMELNYREFVWTGNVGQGWNVAGNWNYSTIPNINRKTIIPADAINWPHLNAGIFSIGSNPLSGAFMSAELWIQQGAQLTTRANNLVRNYGLITIEGLMTVKNDDANTFINNNGAIIKLENTGILKFDPN